MSAVQPTPNPKAQTNVRLARYTELAVAVGGAAYTLYVLMHPYRALLQNQR